MSRSSLVDQGASHPGESALSELVVRALFTHSEAELFATIATWVAQHFDAARVSVALITEDGKSFEVKSLQGPSGVADVGARIPLKGSGLGRAVAEQELRVWSSASEPDLLISAPLTEGGITEILNAPLIVEDQAIGTINLGRLSGERITQDDITTMTVISQLVSDNLARFRLLSHTRHELEKEKHYSGLLHRLSHVGLELSATANEDEVFATVAKALADFFPAARVSLAVPTSNPDVLRLDQLAHEAGSDVVRLGREFPIRSSSVGEVFSTGEPRFWPDLAHSDYEEHRRLSESGLASAVGIPVPIAGKVGAVLNAGTFEPIVLHQATMDVLTGLANLAGSTIDRIRAQAIADQRSRRLDALVDDSPLLLLLVNGRGIIERASRFSISELGFDPATLTNQSMRALYKPSSFEVSLGQIQDLAALPIGSVTSWETEMCNAGGDDVWIRHTARHLDTEPDGPNQANILIVCEDVSELRELSRKLEFQANHDPLTGLLNRREFDRLVEATAAKDNGPLSLAVIDIDHFKLINDTGGHPAGDGLLVELAALLQSVTSASDSVARLGGDEFAVLLNNCALPDAVRVADRMRCAAESMVYSWNGRPYSVALSIGVATLKPGASITDFVAEADDACFVAKDQGRNRVSVIHASDHTSPMRDGEWISRTKDALRDGDLRLAAQPIVATDKSSDGRLRYEALIRMQTDSGLIAAGMFIPVCERFGLITKIDRWVVNEVIDAQLREPELAAMTDYVAINLSVCSIEDDSFLEFLLDKISTPGVRPESLVFEITETSAVSQFRMAKRFIEAVKALGCRFALDDFGAGFSTFHYLRHLPVDIVKIDGSLVKDMSEDPIDREIVRSITQVASAVEMLTVAEFVEDEETLRQLQMLGVDYAQGYGVGKPMALEDLFEQHRDDSRDHG